MTECNEISFSLTDTIKRWGKYANVFFSTFWKTLIDLILTLPNAIITGINDGFKNLAITIETFLRNLLRIIGSVIKFIATPKNWKIWALPERFYCAVTKKVQTDKFVEKTIGWSILGVISAMALLYLNKLYSEDGTWSTDPSSTDEQKTVRQSNRGLIASILVSIGFGIINGLVDSYGNVNPGTSTALFGSLFGGTIGFMADISLGSEQGLSEYKKNMMDGWNFMFGSLASGKYARYIVTVLIDMLISSILFAYLYPIIKKLPFFRLSGYSSIANAVISSVISTITFQAYANQTRFLWAYPDPNTDPSKWIQPITIMLSLSILAIIFLIAPILDADTGIPLIDPNMASGIMNPTVKIVIAVICFMLLTGLYFGGSLQAEPTYVTEMKPDSKQENLMTIMREPNENVKTIDEIRARGFYGKIIFCALLFICTIVTMLSVGSDGAENKKSSAFHLMAVSIITAGTYFAISSFEKII